MYTVIAGSRQQSDHLVPISSSGTFTDSKQKFMKEEEEEGGGGTREKQQQQQTTTTTITSMLKYSVKYRSFNPGGKNGQYRCKKIAV